MSLKSTGSHEIASINIGKKKVAIRFLDEVINISPDTYVEFKLYKGKELSDKEYKDILKKDKYLKDYSYALNLVASRTYNVGTIRNKLNQRKLDKKSIEQIIKKLIDTGLLSDKDYIEAYIESADRKLYGKERIKEELYQKGISKEDIDSINFDEKNEIKKAKELIRKLDYKNQNLAFAKRKQKIQDTLLRNGYTYEIINSLINDINPRNSKIEKESLKRDYTNAYRKYKDKYEGREFKERIISNLLQKGYKYSDIKEYIGEFEL